jgi:16S rRNA (guanine527-N7)-methyltransferase
LADASLRADLERGLAALGEDPGAHPADAYLAWLALLAKWNRAYSLSGIRDPARMLSHHVLDSLSVLPFLSGVRCLDLGSGAGLPGLILALARPGTHWTLLDSNTKKVRFMEQAARELGAANVEVVKTRAESFRPARGYGTITARAFGPLAELHALAAPLLDPGGRLLAMKGAHPERELNGLDLAPERTDLHVLQVPGVNAARSLIIVHGAGAGSSGGAASVR